MDDKIKLIETGVQSVNPVPVTLSQTGDKNIAVAHADNVSIYYGNNAEQKPLREKKSLPFEFCISFAEQNIALDVTSKDGANKAFYTDYTDCKSDDISTKTRNQLMKWYASGCKQSFTVTITDRRIDFAKSQCADVEAKFVAGEELNLDEQLRYNNLGLLIQRFEHERCVKEKAVAFYLKDKLFHAYCHVGFYTHLLDLIKEILDFPYRRGVFQDAEYKENFASFDVYTTAALGDFCGHFVIDLLRSDVEKAYKKGDLLQFPGSFVCDWGVEMAKNIAVQYYVQYIGRQIIDHERSFLETDDYMKKQNTSIHNWLIGPH